MKAIKAWAIVTKRGYYPLLSTTAPILLIYMDADRAKCACAKGERVIRVEIREVGGKHEE